MYRLAVFVICLAAASPALAQSSFENCADQFIGGDVGNAPSLLGQNTAITPLCYRDDDVSFFAVGYRASDLAPVWTAYRLDPANYGENGCNTFTRKKANCYVQMSSWDDFLACPSDNLDASDPFHADHMLSGIKLGPNDFSNTGHDRGHLAPRQAFSWHVCGTYQTFTMANMSPQRAFLNQDLWQLLERQVLTWAVDHGPLYVITGATYDAFPADHFEVFAEGGLKAEHVYEPGVTMQAVVAEHAANRAAFKNQPDNLLRPKRGAKPDKVKDRAKDMRMPTGYFKVIYKPAENGDQARLIAFLLPHSFENLNLAVNFYENVPKENAFWFFVSTVELIEQASGMSFPGIPAEMKDIWGDDFFFQHDESRNIRSDSCGVGTPQGVLEDSTKEARLAACTDQLGE